MTGRVLTQPELCELPPRVSCSSSPPPATSPRAPQESSYPFLAVSPLFPRRRSPSLQPIPTTLVWRIRVRFAQQCFFSRFFSLSPSSFFSLLFHRDPKARTKASRAAIERRVGTLSKRRIYACTQMYVCMFSRRLGRGKRRARSTEASRYVYEEERGRDKGNEGATTLTVRRRLADFLVCIIGWYILCRKSEYDFAASFRQGCTR